MSEELDCTVIIPTHNRKSNITYSIEYYKNTNINIVYVDSSEEEYQFEYVYDNIKYIHLPNVNFVNKILIAVNQVTSNNIILCADDDFLVVSHIPIALNFFNLNLEVQAFIGSFYYFTSNNLTIKPYRIDKIYKKESEFVQNKIIDYFSNYSMILWGLYRKKALMRAFKILDESKPSNDNFIEFVLALVLILEGGIETSNIPWLIREAEQTDNWGLKHKSLIYVDTDDNLKLDMQNVHNSINTYYEDNYFSLAFEVYINNIKNHPNITYIDKLYKKIIFYKLFFFKYVVSDFKRIKSILKDKFV